MTAATPAAASAATATPASTFVVVFVIAAPLRLGRCAERMGAYTSTGKLGLVEPAGEAQGEPGSASPGDQPTGEDCQPRVHALVDDQQERGRVRRDDGVWNERARRVHAQPPIVEGEPVPTLSAQAHLVPRRGQVKTGCRSPNPVMSRATSASDVRRSSARAWTSVVWIAASWRALRSARSPAELTHSPSCCALAVPRCDGDDVREGFGHRPARCLGDLYGGVAGVDDHRNESSSHLVDGGEGCGAVEDGGRHDAASSGRYSDPEYSHDVLSTTSYAVLGMLAVRPWSAYELTKQMRRSLAYCWPKAERGLAQLEEYQTDGGPFPERLHIIVLFADLCARLIDAVEEWAAAAEAEILAWPRTNGLGATPATTQRLADVIDRSRRLLDR